MEIGKQLKAMATAGSKLIINISQTLAFQIDMNTDYRGLFSNLIRIECALQQQLTTISLID